MVMPDTSEIPFWHHLPMLAQQQAAAQTGDIFFWLGMLLVASLVIILVAVIVRKRIMSHAQSTADQAFTLSDLRRMHQQGHMTDEEFARAKAAMIAQNRARLEKQGDADASVPKSP